MIAVLLVWCSTPREQRPKAGGQRSMVHMVEIGSHVRYREERALVT